MNFERIMVSVCCMTYDHKDYIRQCLEGFIFQQTNFPFEVLVHDDASTDGTTDIVREYERKYPEIFRNVYQTENQFKKQNTLVNILFKMAKGKYIALCEGDDYWTDPYKLQKQVDFLEANPEISLYGHNCIIYDQEGKCQGVHLNEKKREKYKNQQRWDINKILINYPFFTATAMFRNNLNWENFFHFDSTYNGDVILYWLSALTGDVFIDFDLIGAVRNSHMTGAGNKIEKNKKRYYRVLLNNLEKIAELDGFIKIREKDYLESYSIIINMIKDHGNYVNILKRLAKDIKAKYLFMTKLPCLSKPKNR